MGNIVRHAWCLAQSVGDRANIPLVFIPHRAAITVWSGAFRVLHVSPSYANGYDYVNNINRSLWETRQPTPS